MFTMKSRLLGVAVIVLSLSTARATPAPLGMRLELQRVNRCIRGQVVDFSHNHGVDRRIWSAALCEKRDMYVYLPPCFDATKPYPLVIYLHGAYQDEYSFLKYIVERVDRAIVAGDLPPLIIAAPDGSLKGQPTLFNITSFFANSDAGRYEDYVMEDVWNFMMANFPIRPEREAHALVGISAGGSAAFAHAIKHRDRVKIAVGNMPAINLRWVDCHNRTESSFDPDCWSWREQRRPMEIVGRPTFFYNIRFGKLSRPLIGHGPDAIAKLSQMNPIEMMDAYDLRPGELDLYAAYGGLDKFNIAPQVESFVYRACERGVKVDIEFDPLGGHNKETAMRLLPGATRWLAPRLAPYSPGE